ncbi:MAG: histidine phosphatase family protein [Actinomycetota bacterium]|nr:histidine phosphatase family protein [Actinomycetota bacterium]
MPTRDHRSPGQRPAVTAGEGGAAVTNGVTRLLALRHGESEWNALGRWQGQADPPLTDAGMLQAVAAAEVLGTFDAVWASSLQRAANTAAIIAELLGVGPVQVEPGLMEQAFGPWQGLTIHEIEEGWPGYLAQHRRPEGAEQPEDAVARATAALRRIAAQHPGGEVLVVSHAGLIRTLRRALDGTDVRFTNLSGCWFDVHPDGGLTAGEVVHLIDPQAFGDTL